MSISRFFGLRLMALALTAAAGTLVGEAAWPAASGDGRSAEMRYPRIDGAGGVYPFDRHPQVPEDAGNLVLDVADGNPPDKVHPGLEHAARALNLYALAGVPEDRVALAVVVHGEATPLVLSDEAYRRHFGQANPNARLLEKLQSHGVQLLLCGQSMRDHGFRVDELAAPVELQLSAMTTLATLQQQGYALVP